MIIKNALAVNHFSEDMNMARRDNGTGTVYQRPNGSWVGRIYMGRGADGKPKYKCFSGKNQAEVKRKIKEIENNKDATDVEQNLMVTLEVCYEFYLRGFHFDPINIYESDATHFRIIGDNALLPPFVSVHGLGEAAALATVEQRKGKEFISIEEFAATCNKLSKTHIEQLKALGAFAGMAETSQVSLF